MKTRLIPDLWLFPVLFSLWLPGIVLALGTEDVVRLHASGYTDDEINEVLSATRAEFLLSARDVVYLSQSGVSDPIVQGMLVALPMQPVNGDATLAAEPVRLLFTQEDLQLLAVNQISEPVVVTFIETRDMAFTLDTERLTALRQSGLGLDALQVLVEKSAANVSVPLAPPVVAGTGEPAPYFYGRSGREPITYIDPYAVTYVGTPTVYLQGGMFSPWYGYDYYPGFAPQYVSYYSYPYQWSGFYGHSFYCPRDHHGGHGHHDWNDHGWNRHDRDHDGNDNHHDNDNDNDGRGGNFVFGGKPDGGGRGGNGVVGGKPNNSPPGRVNAIHFGADTARNNAAIFVGNGSRTVIGTGQIIRDTGNELNGNGNSAVFFGTGITRADKSRAGTGIYSGGKPYTPVPSGVAATPAAKAAVFMGRGNAGTGSEAPAGSGQGIRNPVGNVSGVRVFQAVATADVASARSGMTPGVADAQSNVGESRPSRGRGSIQEEGGAGPAPRFRAGTSTDFVAAPGRRVKPQ